MSRRALPRLVVLLALALSGLIAAPSANASTAGVSGGVLTVANGALGSEDNVFTVDCGSPATTTCTVTDTGTAPS